MPDWPLPPVDDSHSSSSRDSSVFQDLSRISLFLYQISSFLPVTIDWNNINDHETLTLINLTFASPI